MLKSHANAKQKILLLTYAKFAHVCKICVYANHFHVYRVLNEIMTLVLEFVLACIVRDSLCYNIFVSSQ